MAAARCGLACGRASGATPSHSTMPAAMCLIVIIVVRFASIFDDRSKPASRLLAAAGRGLVLDGLRHAGAVQSLHFERPLHRNRFWEVADIIVAGLICKHAANLQSLVSVQNRLEDARRRQDHVLSDS